jgi:NAD(P)-dependent dehydrogenase (short-subunit alcohol dehydrogenase family)
MERIALVTGSSRGIGAATAKLLGQQGYSVGVNYKKAEKEAAILVRDLKHMGCHAIAVQADVSIEADVVRLFREIDDKLGRITSLVNNAGILFPQSKVIELTSERINTLLSTNVTSYFLCCREAIKRMSKSLGGEGGAIVNVSSVASRTGSPNEYIDYAATKGAVDTLTRGLSVEVASEGIRVNGVRPGFIETEIHADGGEPNRVKRLSRSLPMKRGGQPREVAAAIAWLLSDEASYSTGTFIELAGGI